MKKIFYFLFILISLSIVGCKEDPPDNPDNVIGQISVALDANKNVLRSQETFLGNIVCDAFKEYAEEKGNNVDFAIFNSGGIRFNEEVHPDGIYPAGDCDSAMINEIFPWLDAVSSVVEVNGAELKSTFERAVSSLPSEYNGWFLQVSKEVKVVYDLTKTAQVIDNVSIPHSITTEGERVVSIKINGVEVKDDDIFHLTVSRWIANGNDGFVALGNISDDKKHLIYDCEDCEMDREALIYYIQKHSPVTASIEGRIVFQ